VFVSGNFNVLHPGHLRLLNFSADCGDCLVVAVNHNNAPGVMIDAQLRLAGVKAISIVDYAFVLSDPVEEFISSLQPTIVVKGKEHESQYNREKEVVQSYGGELLFSSGEVLFSSLDLLHNELTKKGSSTLEQPVEYIERHKINKYDLAKVLDSFSEMRLLVIGDLIVDEYISCDALGMSQEDPTIVVTPIHEELFVGGAGIVAAHAAGLGANVSYISVVGDDKTAIFAENTLNSYGVKSLFVHDQSRPTTLKQRYRVRGKTLLRVSHLKQHDVSLELGAKLIDLIKSKINEVDLVIFSDFNYGCLPQFLVDQIIGICNDMNLPMVADSQSSSQMGDVSRFKGMKLITPTEHEARIALRDSTSGLVVVAESLRERTEAEHVLITLGAEGVLIHSPNDSVNEVITDQMPALNISPKDVSGAGDCLLITTSMALLNGASIWESAYIGSIAAACQVSRVGNMPLRLEELKEELDK
jgi:rfaE bifunctional protein kinase chain/domain